MATETPWNNTYMYICITILSRIDLYMSLTETGCAKDFPTIHCVRSLCLLKWQEQRKFIYQAYIQKVSVQWNGYTLIPSESSKRFLTMVTHIRLLTSVKSFRFVMITRAAEGFSTILMCLRLYFQVNYFMPVKINRMNSFHIFYTQRVFPLVWLFFHANQELKCWKFSCNVYVQKPPLQFEPFHACSGDSSR